MYFPFFGGDFNFECVSIRGRGWCEASRRSLIVWILSSYGFFLAKGLCKVTEVGEIAEKAKPIGDGVPQVVGIEIQLAGSRDW